MNIKFSIIVATDNKNGIGLYQNNKYTIPWYNKEDINFFKDKTLNGVVIMGKNTFLSLNNKPLNNRLNIVITKSKYENVLSYSSLNEALNYCNENKLNNIYVIGGSMLYHEALKHHNLEYIYINIINNTNNECNIHFPLSLNEIFNNFNYDNNYDMKNSFNVQYMKFINNKNILNENEQKYLNLLKEILNSDNERQTRNSITKSLFGKSLSFDLKNNCFPLLTTKKMFLRGIFEELMWFIRGKTNSKILEDKNVNIWKYNTTNEFINKMNLPYKQGDTGPMYGFQLRHCGAKYSGCDINYNNMGFNQIDYCLKLLENDPFSRRIIMTTFIPHQAQLGVLYPCHGIVIQFYVKQKDDNYYVSCNMYQRSADMFLGLPFNISSYSLLLYIMCHVLTNTTCKYYYPDMLNIYIGDCHIYNNHYQVVKDQIVREPYEFPEIKFKNKIVNIDNFEYKDIEIINYNHHSKLSGTMIA